MPQEQRLSNKRVGSMKLGKESTSPRSVCNSTYDFFLGIRGSGRLNTKTMYYPLGVVK